MTHEYSATKLTPRAERLLQLANSHAHRLNHNFLGTEHLLLGLADLREGRAIAILEQMGIDLHELRAKLETEIPIGPDQGIKTGKVLHTPRVKQVLAVAAGEAQELHREYVGTEDILLGIICEGEGIAARLLQAAGVESNGVRQAVRQRSMGSDEPDNSEDSEWPRSFRDPLSVFVDDGKSYDVYCRETGEGLTLYSNVRFKSVRTLLSPPDSAGLLLDFIELEQTDGKSIFVARSCIVKFCEPGVGLDGEKVQG